ncbi:hypothetical protein NC652_024653 [Populus alba x Populus x berolinensis]|nr:hypothetical protein NC652_024653 [Populus alba x Populus x berolinensis]
MLNNNRNNAPQARGIELEESGGLYSLRVASREDERGDFSYSVAFEELHEAVKSHSKKVIVVKKGQLKLAPCWTAIF